jgi:rubrerythrin
MRTMEEQVVYEKKKRVALSNMGRRGGKRSVIHKMMDGTFAPHMARMTTSSLAKRARQKREKEETEPFILKRNYRCPRCYHYWIGKKTTDPKQCPKCGLRLASKSVRQLNQANLRMYPDKIV